MLDFLIGAAHAQSAAPQAPSVLGSFLLPVMLIVVFYFLLIRPQMKRNKEHRAMLDKLSKGDEVVTTGGIAGRVTELGENFVSVEIADGVVVKMQRSAVGGVLPKGSLKGS